MASSESRVHRTSVRWVSADASSASASARSVFSARPYALCSCGWEGETRLRHEDALSDARAHREEAKGT